MLTMMAAGSQNSVRVELDRSHGDILRPPYGGLYQSRTLRVRMFTQAKWGLDRLATTPPTSPHPQYSIKSEDYCSKGCLGQKNRNQKAEVQTY
jgi:hypothetical protein